MQNVAKISPSKSSLVSSPVSSLKRRLRIAQMLGSELERAVESAGARRASSARVRSSASRWRRRALNVPAAVAGDAGRLLEMRDEQVDARRPSTRRRRRSRVPCSLRDLRRDAGEIDLVGDDRQRAVADVRGRARRRERSRERLAHVGDPEQAIGARDLEPRAAHAFALDGIVRLAQARRVDDGDGQAVERRGARAADRASCRGSP